MKFLLVTLLSALASVNGQTTPMPAPEMVVFYVNEAAPVTACTDQELFYIDSKMVPDMDMTLIANNFETPEWDFTVDATRRNLASATCDWCRTLYPRSLCNSIYNCGFRRNLRNLQTTDTEAVASTMLQDCQYNIMTLSQSQYLSQSCKAAIGAAICHVEVF